MKELECSQDFSHYKSMGIFPDAKGQLTPQSLVRSGRFIELVRDVMDVLITFQYEEDLIKNRGTRVFTTFYINFSDEQGPKFELILAFMHVLVTCKNEDDRLKMKELECSQDFSHFKSMGIFSDAQGQLTPQSLVRSGRTRPRCYECSRYLQV